MIKGTMDAETRAALRSYWARCQMHMGTYAESEAARQIELALFGEVAELPPLVERLDATLRHMGGPDWPEVLREEEG